MKTEARKSFHTGFVLTEEELRRIVNVATQQLEKVSTAKVESALQVKFKNGTISIIGSLDELLSLENIGPKEVIRVHILLAHEQLEVVEDTDRDLPDNFISLQFRNAAEDDDPRPISYVVRGTQRDWVFVTTSELDERVTKIKSRALQRIPAPGSRFIFGRTMLVFLLGLTLGLFLVLTMLTKERSPSAAQAIESQWKAGTLRDPVEAIIIQQKAYERDKALFSFRYFLLIVLGTPIALTAGSELLLALLYYLYPAYVFSWGDNTKLYERRVQIRGYVVTGIVVALAISVIGSIIANRLTSAR